MPVREASAQWNGTLTEGGGTMSFGGGAFEGQYSFASRFEEGEGTNPEELIAAAEAGCYSMALSGDLGNAGHNPERVDSTAKVHIDKVGDGFAITSVELTTEATVPGISDDEFQRIAEGTKENCPVSKALAVEISLEAKLA